MIADTNQGRVLPMSGEVSELTLTPASEVPTAPDAPVPGTALEAGTTAPAERAADEAELDALSLLQRRVHPFA